MERTRSFFEKDTSKLIKAVTGFQEDEENFTLSLDFALSTFVSHRYIDENWFNIRKKVEGLCEKFHVHNEYEKADKLKTASTSFIEHLDKLKISEKTTYYSALSLLIYLCGSIGNDTGSVLNSIDEESTDQDESCTEKFNWGSYLKEKYTDNSNFSESDLEPWTESDDDSLASNLHLTFPPAPLSTDSGIEGTPDSACSSYPPLLPFQPYQQPGSPKKPVHWPKCYWLPQYQTTKIVSDASVVSFTKVWEHHLAQKDPAYTPGTNLVFSEGVVMREMLWMLNGMKGTYLFEWKGDHFHFKNHVHLSHLTEKTLQALVNPLCLYGNKAASLRNFIANVSQRGRFFQRCQVLEAYSYGLEHFLNQYSAVLTSYEEKIVNQEDTLTILQLVNKLKPQFDELEFLHHIHTTVMRRIPEKSMSFNLAVLLLDSLWKQLFENSLWISRGRLLQILFVLFLTSTRPFMSMIESTAMRGLLCDPYNEFFISRNNVVSQEDENFWSSVLVLKDHLSKLSPDFFLQPSFENCVCAGRSMEVLRRLEYYYETEKLFDVSPDYLFNEFVKEFIRICKDYENTSPHASSDADLAISLQQESTDSWFSLPAQQLNPAAKEKDLREVMASHFKLNEKAKKAYSLFDDHLRLCENAANYVHSTSLVPVVSAVKESLLFCVESISSSSSTMLLNALKEKHSLMSHLAVMKKFFLMEAGDIMFSFYTEIFDKIFDHAFWQDESDLNSALKSSVSTVCSDTAERLHIALEEITEDENAPLKQLNTLCITYKVDWPITIILSQEMQDGYCQILHFLLQIKCAKYTLDELYCTPLKHESLPENDNQPLFKRYSRLKIPHAQVIHGMYIMRMKLLHFVNGFHSYIMTRILHSSGLELEEKLDTSTSVDDLLKSHRQYIVSLFERCLLDSKLPYLREQIQRILNLTLKFQAIWRAGIDSLWLQDLREIEEDFSASINFLTSYLKKTWKAGESLHLEALASSILTDTHMIHLFSQC